MTNTPNNQITPTEVDSKPEMPANSSAGTPTNTKELGMFAAGGALVAAGATAGLGILPVAIIGTMAGVTAYGVKKALFDSPTSADPKQPSTTDTITDTVSNLASQTADTVSALTGQAAAWVSQKMKSAAESNNPNSVSKKT